MNPKISHFLDGRLVIQNKISTEIRPSNYSMSLCSCFCVWVLQFNGWNIFYLLLQRRHSCGKKPRGHGSSSEEDAGGPWCKSSPLQRETETGMWSTFKQTYDRQIYFIRNCKNWAVIGLDNRLKNGFSHQKEEEKRKQKLDRLQYGTSHRGAAKHSEVSVNICSCPINALLNLLYSEYLFMRMNAF